MPILYLGDFYICQVFRVYSESIPSLIQALSRFLPSRILSSNRTHFDVKVRHIIDVIHELEKNGKIALKPLNKTIFYHDPCRIGRKNKSGPLYIEPRELLKKCGLKIEELSSKPEENPCCGAGSGIRGVDSSICIKIGKELFNKLKSKEIASSCPLCVFNFRYVNYKNQMNKESKYITDYIFESIRK